MPDDLSNHLGVVEHQVNRLVILDPDADMSGLGDQDQIQRT